MEKHDDFAGSDFGYGPWWFLLTWMMILLKKQMLNLFTANL